MSWLVGLPVGILSALRPNTWADNLARVVTVFFLAIPSFWFALLILIAMTTVWRYHPPIYSVDIWDNPWEQRSDRDSADDRVGAGSGGVSRPEFPARPCSRWSETTTFEQHAPRAWRKE